MAAEVKLSSLGVSITEGTIVRWLKKEGDAVEKGEILAEVETEKVNFEIVAPEAGIQARILLNIFIHWMPAFAGMTNYDTASEGKKQAREMMPGKQGRIWR